MFQLAALCIVKDEEMVLTEWLEHYLWQGVEHFYMIDNESTDNTKGVLEPYINKGIVTYIYATGRAQVNHYNEAFNTYIRNTDVCEWLMICDADEFIYNTTPRKNIRSYIEELPDTTVNAIECPWKMFGSSGFETQPSCIRTSFTWRSNIISKNVKQIVKVNEISYLHVHDHVFKTNKTIIKNPPELALNHYAIMSKEYFVKVKMTRGDVASNDPITNNIRDLKYFKNYDQNDVLDVELKNIIICIENA